MEINREVKTKTRGTLGEGESHPAANIALEYMRTISLTKLAELQESFSSLAIEGNRLAEVCAETMERWIQRRPLSDRYLMGLAWAVKQILDEQGE